MEHSEPREPQRTPIRDSAGEGALESTGTPTLSLTVQHRGLESFVSLNGELDLSSAPPLRELLASVFTEGPPRRLVLDLTDLIYLDSTGLSVFVTAHKRAGASGIEFCLANPNASVRRLLQITALDQIFVIVDAPDPDGSEDAGPADTE